MEYKTLKSYNTLGLDAKAKAIWIASSKEELLFLFKKAKWKKLPILLLGKGSNVFFIKNFNGVVILNRIKELKITESSKKWFIHVGAGNIWHELVKTLLNHGIYGLENLAFIPGCAGAAPIHNIGAYGLEFQDVCNYVDILNLKNGSEYRLKKSECKFGYRESIFKNQYYYKNFAITSIGLELNKVWKPILTYNNAISKKNQITAKDIFYNILYLRKKKLPNPFIFGNAGSFFKNPILKKKDAKILKKKYPNCPEYTKNADYTKISAGWLIEQCNLKNYEFGGAAVYVHQPLVLINKNRATGKDFINLANYIRKKVMHKFSILLEPEVCFIGKNGILNSLDHLL
ncbi:MAG: UDP-N-acetylmuramate dehydrogenase [Arsenophonus sp.]|nr:MAG: UDP-N-acetylmuramate dehydrogenase [Arsenophonus sp.]